MATLIACLHRTPGPLALEHMSLRRGLSTNVVYSIKFLQLLFSCALQNTLSLFLWETFTVSNTVDTQLIEQQQQK